MTSRFPTSVLFSKLLFQFFTNEFLMTNDSNGLLNFILFGFLLLLILRNLRLAWDIFLRLLLIFSIVENLRTLFSFLLWYSMIADQSFLSPSRLKLGLCCSNLFEAVLIFSFVKKYFLLPNLVRAVTTGRFVLQSIRLFFCKTKINKLFSKSPLTNTQSCKNPPFSSYNPSALD